MLQGIIKVKDRLFRFRFTWPSTPSNLTAPPFVAGMSIVHRLRLHDWDGLRVRVTSHPHDCFTTDIDRFLLPHERVEFVHPAASLMVQLRFNFSVEKR